MVPQFGGTVFSRARRIGRRIRQRPADLDASLDDAQTQIAVEDPDLDMVGLGRPTVASRSTRQAGSGGRTGWTLADGSTRPQAGHTAAIRRAAS